MFDCFWFCFSAVDITNNYTDIDLLLNDQG